MALLITHHMPDPALISKYFRRREVRTVLRLRARGSGLLFAWSEPRQKNDASANYQKYLGPNPPRFGADFTPCFGACERYHSMVGLFS